MSASSLLHDPKIVARVPLTIVVRICLPDLGLDHSSSRDSLRSPLMKLFYLYCIVVDEMVDFIPSPKYVSYVYLSCLILSDK
jgi:hypothetical protein